MSRATNFPRSDPFLVVNDLNFGIFGTLHAANTSVWCYTADDMQQLYVDYTFVEEAGSEERGATSEGSQNTFPVIGVSIGEQPTISSYFQAECTTILVFSI